MGNFINFSLVNLLTSHSEEELRGDIWVKKEEQRRRGEEEEEEVIVRSSSGSYQGSYRM